jgi:AraC family transcriptional regulator of adaptative response/methylated-DNA-[protein]-cysteine methyltransferase
MSQTYYDIGCTSLGAVSIVIEGESIVDIAIDNDPDQLKERIASNYSAAQHVDSHSLMARAMKTVLNLIEGEREIHELPLKQSGTAFQLRVWRELSQIPYGQTMSYSELAKKLSQPKAVRAVAAACGANKLAVLVPCHRVIGKRGQITGYRWGVDKKQRLLDVEKAVLSR